MPSPPASTTVQGLVVLCGCSTRFLRWHDPGQVPRVGDGCVRIGRPLSLDYLRLPGVVTLKAKVSSTTLRSGRRLMAPPLSSVFGGLTVGVIYDIMMTSTRHHIHSTL